MIDLTDFILVKELRCSRRLYRLTCDKCRKDRGYQRKNSNGLGLCKSCVATFLHKGARRSDATKEKMSKNSWARNGFTHPLLGKKHSEKTKRKISRATCAQNKAYKSSFEYVGPKGTISMKSSWEVKYAVHLDSINESWVYEPVFELSNGYFFIPDFQLSTGDIIEIKGYMRPDAQIKWDMFCEDYPSVKKSLLRKDDLQKLGLI